MPLTDLVMGIVVSFYLSPRQKAATLTFHCKVRCMFMVSESFLQFFLKNRMPYAGRIIAQQVVIT
jgi:hypothetical protein